MHCYAVEICKYANFTETPFAEFKILLSFNQALNESFVINRIYFQHVPFELSFWECKCVNTGKR